MNWTWHLYNVSTSWLCSTVSSYESTTSPLLFSSNVLLGLCGLQKVKKELKKKKKKERMENMFSLAMQSKSDFNERTVWGWWLQRAGVSLNWNHERNIFIKSLFNRGLISPSEGKLHCEYNMFSNFGALGLLYFRYCHGTFEFHLSHWESKFDGTLKSKHLQNAMFLQNNISMLQRKTNKHDFLEI